MSCDQASVLINVANINVFRINVEYEEWQNSVDENIIKCLYILIYETCSSYKNRKLKKRR